MNSSMNDNRSDCIYVLLTHTGTIFTTLIKLFTAAPYNHASLALDADLNEMFSFGRKRAANPFIAGFVEEDVGEGTYRLFPNTRCKLLRLNVTRQQKENVEAFIRFLQRERDNYRYNLLGLLGVLLKRDLKLKNAYFCTQFVAETLRQSGIRLWERPSALVTPNDFLQHPDFEILYEGLLHHYPPVLHARMREARELQVSGFRFTKKVF
ncbi:hypothetical protein ACF3MZ_30530 [Paenibacillaceae bacterium WGS1546]|uniref:hypothetical protein n=1 Tax=Cohnella sp. WGS1546 TaxID=3366810 RepID=UPI00372D373C